MSMITRGYICRILNAPLFAGLLLLICFAMVIWLGYSVVPGKIGFMFFFSTSSLILLAIFCRFLCGEQENYGPDVYELLATEDITDEQVWL